MKQKQKQKSALWSWTNKKLKGSDSKGGTSVKPYEILSIILNTNVWGFKINKFSLVWTYWEINHCILVKS